MGCEHLFQRWRGDCSECLQCGEPLGDTGVRPAGALGGHDGPHHVRWAANFAAYTTWVQVNGCHPRQRGADAAESALGEWARTQRRAYRVGTLPPDRVEQLESVPGWAWNRHDAGWAATLTSYRSWVVGHDGDHPRVEGGDDTERQLGLWAARQRQSHRAGELAASRAAALDGMPGWRWEPYQESWEEVLVRYRTWVKTHGRIPQVRAGDRTERSLGEWAKGQRRARRKGVLPADRVALLDATPGWVWELDAR